jgi:hypothetical protein
MLMTASRTIDAVPGIKSAAFNHFVSVTLVGSENSRVSSIVPAATVCSTPIGILRSGGPSFHCGLNVTVGNFTAGSPCGVPPDAHVRIISMSRELIGYPPLTNRLVGSTGQGGMRPAVSSSRIDSAHGAASLYVMSDIGAGPPLTWQLAQ